MLFRVEEDNRVVVLRKGSLEAVNEIEDNSLDFIYIDGNHNGDNPKNDISAWYKKMKPGGFMCGHDYKGYDSVRKAVDEFCNSHEFKLNLVGNTEDFVIRI